MTFLVELVVQAVVYLVVELVGEGLLEAGAYGAVRALATRTGRYVAVGLTGLVVGLAWGRHLTGSPTWPRLLWVSLVAALAAGLLAAGGGGTPPAAALAPTTWRRVLVPPWRWSAERLVGFAIFNLSVASGIAVFFDVGA